VFRVFEIVMKVTNVFVLERGMNRHFSNVLFQMSETETNGNVSLISDSLWPEPSDIPSNDLQLTTSWFEQVVPWIEF
jgi:hypothetical protein